MNGRCWRLGHACPQPCPEPWTHKTPCEELPVLSTQQLDALLAHDGEVDERTLAAVLRKADPRPEFDVEAGLRRLFKWIKEEGLDG